MRYVALTTTTSRSRPSSSRMNSSWAANGDSLIRPSGIVRLLSVDEHVRALDLVGAAGAADDLHSLDIDFATGAERDAALSALQDEFALRFDTHGLSVHAHGTEPGSAQRTGG